MLKILHLVSGFFPLYNGTTTRLYGLLSNIPYETIVITSNEIGSGNVVKLKEECFGNITVKRVPLKAYGIYAKAPIRYIHTIYQRPKMLFNSVRSEEFDIIHAHESSIFLQSAKKSSVKLNKPLIIEFHAVRDEYVAISRIGRFFAMSLYEKRKIKDALKPCNHVITLTPQLKDWISNRYKIKKDKITVVPNGVDITIFTPKHMEKTEELKRRLKLSNTVVMYSGAINQINGINDFATVIPSIINKNPNISFLFIGRGTEEGKIITLSKKYTQVNYLPMVPYSDMPIYYQLCDLFVIPRPSSISTETITPLKLFEVMAMEKPVLGSNVGGIAEIIKHGENGFLFEKGNLESFKNTLLEILDTDTNQIGKNARKMIVDNYTWDKSAKILQKVYEGLG